MKNGAHMECFGGPMDGESLRFADANKHGAVWIDHQGYYYRVGDRWQWRQVRTKAAHG